MGKLSCTCGHIIVDQTDNLSYKGYILPDSHVDKVSITLTESIDSLIDSISSNRKLEWIKSNFDAPPYPVDLDNSAMIHDLMTKVIVETTQDIFECENCGRIAIQIGQTSQFKFFSPDTDDSKGILIGGNKS